MTILVVGNIHSGMKILLIEDDIETAEFIVKGLKETGYVIDHTRSGEDGLYLAKNRHYDALIVDRMLPDKDGLSIIKELRASKDGAPILILSALGDVDDRVVGLKAGADDYLPKPFAFSELVARIEALIRRRYTPQTIDKLIVDDLVIDLKRYKVTRDNKHIDLTPQEFKLLEYLARHKGQIVTRTMLIENVWDYNFEPQTNIVDVHISRLRAKIDRNFKKQLIQTLRGIGYKIG